MRYVLIAKNGVVAISRFLENTLLYDESEIDERERQIKFLMECYDYRF